MSDTSNPPAPGWYPDPQVPGQQRYWNGTAWTDNVSPVVAPNAVPGYPASGSPMSAYPPVTSEAVGTKSFIATWLFSLLLGYLGVDRFYLGKVGTGILKLITFGGVGIWYLIDLIFVLVGATRDAQGFKLAGYDNAKVVAWVVTGVLLLVSIVSGAINGTNF